MFVVLVTLVFVSLANVIMLEGVVKVWIRLRLVGLKVCVGLKRECSSQAVKNGKRDRYVNAGKDFYSKDYK